MTDIRAGAKDHARTESLVRPRTKPAEVRLDELMGAAEKLFLEQGVEATTISEIVEEAQVAKGTFYHYFASKNEMLTALGQRYTQQFLAKLESAVSQRAPDDWIGRFQAWIEANVATYLKTYLIHDIVYTNHHHHERSNNEKNAVLEQLMGILEGGRAAGVWPLAQPRITALLIYCGVHGAADDAIVSGLDDSTAFSKSVSNAYLRMLGAVGFAP